MNNSFDFTQLHPYIIQLEEEDLVTRTYRRLDPERQQAVFQAILDEASEHGPAAMNIKRVAERAGVSVGSLYQYFGDRDKMLDFAVELTARYVCDLFNEFSPYLAALPLRQALTYYLSGGVEWSKTQAGFLGLFARAAYQGDPELAGRLVKPIASLLRQMVADILAQAAERGEIRPDVDLEAATRIVHALSIAVGDSMLLPYLNNYFQVTDEGMAPERALEAFVDLVLSGIGHRYEIRDTE